MIALALGIYVLAALIPGAFGNFFNANTTGWDAGTVALWAIIPLVIIAVLVHRLSKGSGE